MNLPYSPIHDDNELLDAYSNAVISVVEKVGPSVVQIQTNKNVSPTTQGQGLGSGVIITPDGFILTNSHVVHGARKIDVTLADTRAFPANVIGEDPETDLAVLRIGAGQLPSLEFADSKKLRVGQIAVAETQRDTRQGTALREINAILAIKCKLLQGFRNTSDKHDSS